MSKNRIILVLLLAILCTLSINAATIFPARSYSLKSNIKSFNPYGSLIGYEEFTGLYAPVGTNCGTQVNCEEIGGRNVTSCVVYDFGLTSTGLIKVRYAQTQQPIAGDTCVSPYCGTFPGFVIYTSQDNKTWSLRASLAETPPETYQEKEVQPTQTYRFVMACRAGGGHGRDNIKLEKIYISTSAPTPPSCLESDCFINAVYERGSGSKNSQDFAKDVIYSAKVHNSKVINYLADTTETSWNNLMALLVEVKNTDMEIWITLRPPTEGGNSYPYLNDFKKWVSEIAKLSQTYPNIRAWAIDDFSHNYEKYPPDYLAEMKIAANEFNPNLKFIPVIYYRDLINLNKEKFNDRKYYFDAVQFYYRAESALSDQPPGKMHFDPFESERLLYELDFLKDIFNKDIIIGIYAKRHSTVGFSSANFVRDLANLAGQSADGVIMYWQDSHRCNETNDDQTYTTKENREKLEIIKTFFGKKICNNNMVCEKGEDYANCPKDCVDSFEQFPSSSSASSEFSSAWSAGNVVSYQGKEDCKVNGNVDFPGPYFRCGGYLNNLAVSEWKKKTIDETATITLNYPSFVNASSIEIIGNELFITKIEAKKNNGLWETVWGGNAYDDFCFLKIGLTRKIVTQTIRITTGAGKWSSIGAAKLIGKSADSTGLFGDLNHDNKLDFEDMHLLVGYFDNYGQEADLNGDNKVNIFDLVVLAKLMTQ